MPNDEITTREALEILAPLLVVLVLQHARERIDDVGRSGLRERLRDERDAASGAAWPATSVQPQPSPVLEDQ